MKKFLKILLGIVVVIGLGIGAVFFTTSGAVDTADKFFKSVAEGDMDTARTYLAEGFTNETSEEDLLRFLDASGLSEYREADWSGRSIDGSSGKLTGKVITQSGATVPLSITFVKEDGDWKIYYIQREGAGLASASKEVPLPDRAESALIVKATTAAFGEAVKAKDLSGFHAASAREFQEQVSLETFNDGFSDFIENDIDLTVLETHEPLFTTQPAISAEGVLQLEGYYDTRPSRAVFDYTYVHRDGEWKLLGISFNVVPVEE